MKTLYNICEASLTHPVYEVSILADIDDQIEAYDKSIPDRIEKWIRENYNIYGTLKISNKPNRNGLYEVFATTIYITNKKITSLTNGMFEWVKAKNFDCSYCNLLKTLEGAPKEVGGDFFCYRTAIKDLKGAPKKVEGDFYFHECKNLSSLEGAPTEIGGDVYCRGCKTIFSSDDIRKVSKVKGRIAVGI